MASKLYIYFKKEFKIESEDDLDELKEFIKKASNLNLFDELYILKDRELEEIRQNKEDYLLACIKDTKYLKEEVSSLKNIIRKLLRIVYELEDGFKEIVGLRRKI